MRRLCVHLASLRIHSCRFLTVYRLGLLYREPSRRCRTTGLVWVLVDMVIVQYLGVHHSKERQNLNLEDLGREGLAKKN